MSACEVLTERPKGNRTRKAKKEPNLVLRSGPETNGDIVNDVREEPPSYEKCIFPVPQKSGSLPNGHYVQNSPNGTRTTVTALVHNDVEPHKIIPNELEPLEKAEDIVLGLEHDAESIDIHGNKTPHKDADFNDNYLQQETEIEEDDNENAELEKELREYVLAEQAKGLQTKSSSYKRPDYAAQIYGGVTVSQSDVFDEPKMLYLKVSDHEGSLSGIDISEAELDKSYEADEELSIVYSRELTPVLSKKLVSEETIEKQESRHYLEKIAEILLGNEKPDETTLSEDDVVTFLADAPDKVCNMIAYYLKTRKLSCLLLCTSNFHYALHASAVLELTQLTSHCYEFLDENPQFDQRSLVRNCEKCQSLILSRDTENVKVMTKSKVSSPHFCIAFSRQDAQRTNIDVIDINTGSEIYNRDTKRPFLCDRGFACCSVHFHDCPYVFVSGGKHKHSRQMWRYDVIVSEWKKVPNMIHGRSYHSMIAFNNCAIYVIGGADVSCIEEYSLDTKRWSECVELGYPVESGACAVYEKKIYIFGGNGSVGRVQCFTPSTNKMEVLHPLPCPVMDGYAVVFRDKIFIFTGQGQVVSFEPVTGLSYICASQPIIRSKFCLFVNGDKVYITGGRLEEESPEQESEYNYRYNMSTNAWTRTRKLPKKFAIRTFCDVHIQRRCPVVPFDKMKI